METTNQIVYDITDVIYKNVAQLGQHSYKKDALKYSSIKTIRCVLESPL